MDGKEKWEKMTPLEINEAVAKKLGWVEYEGKEPPFKGNYGPKKLWRKNGKDSVRVLPDYCHSIAAAWEILESVRKWEIKREGKTIIVYLWINEHFQGVGGDTAPMAICLAFLKLEAKEK